MFFDDLPVWGYIGKEDSTMGTILLYTHVHFDVTFNEDRVIGMNVSTDKESPLDITKGDKAEEVSFSYSVKWKETETPYERRMDRFSRESVLPHNLEVQ